MTATERAIAALWYRLVYVERVQKLSDVPTEYRAILEQYRKSLGK